MPSPNAAPTRDAALGRALVEHDRRRGHPALRQPLADPERNGLVLIVDLDRVTGITPVGRVLMQRPA